MPRTTIQIHYKTSGSKSGSAFAATGAISDLGWEIERAFIGPVIEDIGGMQAPDDDISSEVEVVFRASHPFSRRLDEVELNQTCRQLRLKVKNALEEGGHIVVSCDAVPLEDLYELRPVRLAVQIEIADMPGVLAGALQALHTPDCFVADEKVKTTLDGLLCCPLHVGVDGDGQGIIEARFSPFALRNSLQSKEISDNPHRVANAILNATDKALENCHGVRSWSLIATNPRITLRPGRRGKDDFRIHSEMPRGCYAPHCTVPSRRVSIRQANATKCKPATVSGKRS